MGAAIDNEQVSTIRSSCNPNNPPLSCSGNAIQSTVERFYNLYNPQDNMLESVYGDAEDDRALGWSGIRQPWVREPGIVEPSNYNEYNVMFELAPIADADGDGECDLRYWLYSNEICTIAIIGDNHYGYLGYRNSDYVTIRYNGAIDRVVMDWNQ